VKLTRIILITLLLAFATSCVPGNGSTSLQVKERVLSFPPAYYNHVVYINDRVIGFAQDSDAPKEQQISFAYEGDKDTTRFNPQDDPDCKRYSYFQVVSLLPDGRLGLFKECKVDLGISAFRTIVAYDWNTGELEQLVPGRFPLFGPKFYTWNPDMTLGVQETGSGYPGTIYWIKRDGISPMDIQIEDRGLTWNLKDYYEGKKRTGGVRHPAWSLDGNAIAFFVTTYGILEEPEPKFNVNYDLFFMDPHALNPKLELMDIADAGKIVWSPNNEFLLFRGCIGQNLICGLWRYRIADKSLSLVKEGEFADYIWITNDRIVAAKFVDLSYKDSEIWEYFIIE
jgi:hypothetical protein